MIRIHSAEWYIEIEIVSSKVFYAHSWYWSVVDGGARSGISSSDKLPDPNRGFQSRVCYRWLSAVMF